MTRVISISLVKGTDLKPQAIRDILSESIQSHLLDSKVLYNHGKEVENRKIRVSKSIHDNLTTLSERTGVPVTTLVSFMVEQHLNQVEEPTNLSEALQLLGQHGYYSIKGGN